MAARSEAVTTELERLREKRRQQSEASRAVSDQLDGSRRARSEASKRQDEVRELMRCCDLLLR